MAPADTLRLLMVHADDHAPVGAVGETGASSEGNEDPALPEHLFDDSAAPDDLTRQRWGVVAPEGAAGDRMLALIKPLMELRREQQGGDAIVVHRVPPGMDARAAERWRDRVYHPQDDLDLEVPRYLAVLGDLDQVSLELQQVLATNRSFPGRLCFDEDAHYESYVDKLLRWERKAATTEHTRGEALLYTAHDGTDATRVGHQALMDPGLAVLQRRAERGQLPLAALASNSDNDADPDAFFDLARRQLPGVLFSMSHGDGPPRSGWTSAADQRARQGAMSFGSNGSLQASDFASGRFMEGGLWFMLACFGAGTPARSSYHHWLARLEAAGEFEGAAHARDALDPRGTGFVAALPKAVLANPDGPLGFVGHVDLAWTYGFQDAEERQLKRPARYMGIVRSALERHRAGVALFELMRHVGSVNSSLSMLYDSDAQGVVDPRAKQRGHLWMVRQDLQAYLLMGDPAVRLPLRDPRAPVVSPAPAPAVASTEATPDPEPGSGGFGLKMETWEFEEILGRHLAGDLSARKLADALDLDRSTAREVVARYKRAGRAAVGLPDED